jgi:hypothetical protein
MRLSILLLAMVASAPSLAANVDTTNGQCRFPFAIPSVVTSSHLVFLGELHGTNEAPALAAEFACELTRDRDGVTLSLEIPESEQSQINRYLASAGTAADQSELVSTQFWQAPNGGQDGRRSLAMLALLERLRQLRATNVKVDVLAFDGWSADAPRDATMAASLLSSIRQHPRAKFLVLVGNVHASKAKGSPWDPLYEPMAFLISSESPLSLLVHSSAGTAWVCTGDKGCGVHEVASVAKLPIGLAIGNAPTPGYDGTVVLKSFSASLPALPSKSRGAKE